jgi:lipid-binding SYLF domain-containing protein
MTNHATPGRRGARTGLLLAAALSVLLAPGIGSGQTFQEPYGYVYGIPDRATVSAKQADIDILDNEAQALIDQMRAGSPVAVDFAKRAHGVLIFPRVETSSFILGETQALGVLYVKDATGAYHKADYYRGERNSLGFQRGSGTSSRFFMFMTPEALEKFRKGKIETSFMAVDPETGATSGDPDSEVAAFVANVTGNVRGASVRGLELAPVEIIKE